MTARELIDKAAEVSGWHKDEYGRIRCVPDGAKWPLCPLDTVAYLEGWDCWGRDLAAIGRRLGLDSEHVCGIVAAADVSNSAILYVEDRARFEANGRPVRAYMIKKFGLEEVPRDRK